jgi:AcrR family transcriptional regulator
MPRPKKELVKDKERTKRKMIDAIGEALRNEGYLGLKINKIARIGQRTGFSKKLIYNYFGSFDRLVEAYIIEKDFWMTYSDSFRELINEHNVTTSQKLISATLQNQFRFFYTETEMQELIRWELSGGSKLMRSIHNVRETLGEKFLDLAEPHFEGSNINIRPIAALLVGGIYNTILHIKYNGGMYCGLDLNTKEGTDAIIKAIDQIVGWAYKEGKKAV